MPYVLSDRGYEDLVQKERNYAFVYDDATGKSIPSYESAKGFPSIGLGLKIDTAEERQKFAPYLNGNKAPDSVIAEANAATIATFTAALNRKAGHLKMTQSMFDALFSLAWNTGYNSDVVARVIDYIGAEDYESAAHAIATGPVKSKGKTQPGLVARRAEEAALFLKDKFDDATKAATGFLVPPRTGSPRRWFDNPITWVYFAMVVTIGGLATRRLLQAKRRSAQG
jgi:GH24 family phage-related lysozyme (muramidase)